MHDLLLENQEQLLPKDLMEYAERLGLDPRRFHDDVKRHVAAAHVAPDVESADLSGVSRTPTFFITDNGTMARTTYRRSPSRSRRPARVAIKTEDPGPLLRRRSRADSGESA